MSKMVLGCIADDFTGATDLANNLVRAGMRVVQTIGVPKARRAEPPPASAPSLGGQRGHEVPSEGADMQPLAADYTPLSAVDIFVKDLGLVLDMARASKFPLPLSSTAHQMFMQASTAGFAKEDDSAVIKIFPGIELPKPKDAP